MTSPFIPSSDVAIKCRHISEPYVNYTSYDTPQSPYVLIIMELIVTRDHQFKRDEIKNKLVETVDKCKNVPGTILGATFSFGIVSTAYSSIGAALPMTTLTPIGAALYSLPVLIASWKAASSAKRLIELALTNTVTTGLYTDVNSVPIRLWDVLSNCVVCTDSIGNFKYHAISHTWHKHDEKTRLPGMDWDAVGINAEELHDTRCFLLKCNIKYVWVDNLCINQGDDKEKGDEIKKMGAFYANCESTIVFPYGLGYFKPIVDEDIGPWFNRVWTLQELMASHNPKFVIYRDGNILLGANCVRNILTDAITSHIDISVKNTCLSALEDLTIHGSSGMTLVDAIYQSFCRDVTRDEDRVYGILGFMGSRSDKIVVKIGEGLDYAIGQLRKVLTPEEHVNMAIVTTGRIAVDTMVKRYKTLAALERLFVDNLRIVDGGAMYCTAYVTRLSDSYHTSRIGSEMTFADKDATNISVRLMKTVKYSYKPGRTTLGKWCSCGKCIKKHSDTPTDLTSAIDFTQYERTGEKLDHLWLIALFTTQISFLENVNTCLICSLDNGIYYKKGVAYVDKRVGNWNREQIHVKNIW